MPDVMPGGECADVRQSSRCEDVVGLLEYLDWRDEYRQSDREGQLSMLFCAAFQVDAPALQDIEDDLIADSLIRSTYCYDDFVADVETSYESR